MRCGWVIRTLLSIIILPLIFGAGSATRLALAQEATPLPQEAAPLASPVAGGVPCTELFGIAPGNACLLALHGSIDSGPLDVYVDGLLMIPGTTFGTLGDFIPVPAGNHLIQFVPSGAGIDATVLGLEANVAEGVAYEVSALGPASEISGMVLPVDTRPLAVDSTRIRMVHGSVDTGPVDLAIEGGVPLIVELPSGEASTAVEVPSGTYALEVRAAGTTDVLVPLPGTNLFPNTTYTFYLTGTDPETSLGITLVPVLIPPELAGAPAATPVG